MQDHAEDQNTGEAEDDGEDYAHDCSAYHSSKPESTDE